MATFKADRATSTVSARRVPVGPVVEHASWTGSAALSAGDVVQLIHVGPGAKLVSAQLLHNGAEKFQVGDGNDDNRYFSGETTKNVATPDAMTFSAGFGYEYTATDTVDVTFNNASGTTSAPHVEAIFTVYYDDGDV